MGTLVALIKKNPAATSLAVILCAVLICGGMYIQALNQPDLFDNLSPAKSTLVEEGETISVKVLAGEVDDLYGYQFELIYDDEVLEYQSLESSIEEISMIFHKDFDGYLLVGATKIGDEPGFTAENTPVCEIKFTAKSEEALELLLSDVSVVTSEMDYLEDLDGWGIEIDKQ